MDRNTKQIELLKHHGMNLAGYAFRLARDLHLSPQQAARIWMKPAMQGISPAGEATPE